VVTVPGCKSKHKQMIGCPRSSSAATDETAGTTNLTFPLSTYSRASGTPCSSSAEVEGSGFRLRQHLIETGARAVEVAKVPAPSLLGTYFGRKGDATCNNARLLVRV